jgi:DNA-binding response OmpR family regulator
VIAVDDDQDVVVSLLTLMAIEGVDARGAYNAREALDMVRLYKPQAVLIDIGLPDMNGCELARRIRELEAVRRPLLIGLTGRFKQEADRLAGELSGFTHYLTKPYDPNELIRLLLPLRHSP